MLLEMAIGSVPLAHMAISSAKREILMLDGGVGMMSIRMMKRIGLRTLPCGVPFCVSAKFDDWLPMRTEIVRSERKSLIQVSILPLIPIWARRRRIPSLQTRSNAFSISRKTPIVDLDAVSDDEMSCCRRMMWSVVERFSIKPDCSGRMSWFSFR